MGALAFISSLVQALAWPAAAVILGLIFRRQISNVFEALAQRMKHLARFRAAGAALSFDPATMTPPNLPTTGPADPAAPAEAEIVALIARPQPPTASATRKADDDRHSD